MFVHFPFQRKDDEVAERTEGRCFLFHGRVSIISLIQHGNEVDTTDSRLENTSKNKRVSVEMRKPRVERGNEEMRHRAEGAEGARQGADPVYGGKRMIRWVDKKTSMWAY